MQTIDADTRQQAWRRFGVGLLVVGVGVAISAIVEWVWYVATTNAQECRQTGSHGGSLIPLLITPLVVVVFAQVRPQSTSWTLRAALVGFFVGIGVLWFVWPWPGLSCSS
jgi:FtsH-binding integral membrane protein